MWGGEGEERQEKDERQIFPLNHSILEKINSQVLSPQFTATLHFPPLPFAIHMRDTPSLHFPSLPLLPFPYNQKHPYVVVKVQAILYKNQTLCLSMRATLSKFRFKLWKYNLFRLFSKAQINQVNTSFRRSNIHQK